MVTPEYVVSTALAAFFASLAAVAVSWILDRSARRRDAKAEILRACARHIDRLWTYSTVHSEVMTAGIGNAQTTRGQYAPFKPPIRGLTTEVEGVRSVFPMRARSVVDEITDLFTSSEVQNENRGTLADWQGESEAVSRIAERIARWDGKASQLPK